MKKSVLRAACQFVLLFGMTGLVQAQNAEQERAFAASLVDAINNGSVERRKALMHPRALACGNQDTRSMTEEMIKRQTRHRIPADFKWRVARSPAGETPFFADKFDYPVRPTHRLQIDFNSTPKTLSSSSRSSRAEDDLRLSAQRCRPYGSEDWASKITKQLGLESTKNSRGRPKLS